VSLLTALKMSPWLAILLLLGVVSYQGSQIHKWHVQSDKHLATLNSISAAKNQQQVVTRDRIKTVTKTIHDADGKAKVIEAAPLPGNCRSPKEVLDADI
jgi:hypothetical protein